MVRLCEGAPIRIFSAVGTTFGDGDGETTFNLPDLIDRFAPGSSTPGQKIAAGLPNIEGDITNVMVGTNYQSPGAFLMTVEGVSPTDEGTTSSTVCLIFQLGNSTRFTVNPKLSSPAIIFYIAALHQSLRCDNVSRSDRCD